MQTIWYINDTFILPDYLHVMPNVPCTALLHFHKLILLVLLWINNEGKDVSNIRCKKHLFILLLIILYFTTFERIVK